MTARVVIGKRGSEFGLWASRTGIDALTAPDSQLLLNMGESTEQLVLIGSVSSSQVVPLGFSSRPLVMLITVPGGSTAVRPSPYNDLGTGSRAVVSAASMTIFVTQPCTYFVLRRSF